MSDYSPEEDPLPDDDLTPLDASSLRDRALRSIRASIVSGRIEAGHIYSASHFASKLGVSATPVREALFDLAATGTVEVVRNRGFRVPVLTDSDLDELLELRMLLERPAVVRIVETRAIQDSTELRRLASDISWYARRGDVVAFLASDRRFHGELLRYAENGRLQAFVMNVRDQTRLYGLRRLAQSGDLVASAREHRDLVSAVEAGDTAKADRVITRHLLHTRGIWAGRTEGESRRWSPLGTSHGDEERL